MNSPIAMTNRLLFTIISLIILSGCASTPPSQSAAYTNDSTEIPNVDPYEGFNRTMFRFNNGVDAYFLKPITKGYRYITPNFVERGVSNFFSNLLEVSNVTNSLLQAKGSKAAHSMGRFLLNTTLGIGGLFDVANVLGLEKIEGEDFGQTLGAWGVNSGPYLVLPLLGPSNIRDGIAIPVNNYLDPVSHLDDVPTRNGTQFLKIVDIRSKLLDSEQFISGDHYIFIRDAYLQRRQYLISDGEIEDTFGEGIDLDFQ